MQTKQLLLLTCVILLAMLCATWIACSSGGSKEEVRSFETGTGDDDDDYNSGNSSDDDDDDFIGDDDDDSGSDDDDATVAEGYAVGQRLPGFNLPDKDGNPVALNDYDGDVRIVDCMAIWCPSCAEGTPALENNFYQAYKDQGFTVIQIVTEDGNEQPITLDGVGAWVTQNGLTFPVVANPDWSVCGNMLIDDMYIPAYYLIDKNGVIQLKGSATTGFHAKIQELLG